MEKKWVKHIVKEGSRKHVISWSNLGAKCSEPDCEINKSLPNEATEQPTKEKQA